MARTSYEYSKARLCIRSPIMAFSIYQYYGFVSWKKGSDQTAWWTNRSGAFTAQYSVRANVMPHIVLVYRVSVLTEYSASNIHLHLESTNLYSNDHSTVGPLLYLVPILTTSTVGTQLYKVPL